jgi:hypothetical protein
MNSKERPESASIFWYRPTRPVSPLKWNSAFFGSCRKACRTWPGIPVQAASGAGSVRIVFDIAREEIELTITDWGRGFSPSEVKKKGGLGLLSMEERALSMGGRLTVTSSPGAGTEVHMKAPLQAYSSLVSDEAVTDGISNQFRNRLEPELPHRR